MNILNLESISKHYGDKELFRDISLGINAGERLGLIGINGSGKSTLFKIIAGLEEPDSGRVTLRSEARVAYLAQDPAMPPEQTVLDYVYGEDNPALRLLHAYAEVSAQLEARPADGALLDKLAQLGEQLTRTNGWDSERAARTILSRLGVRDINARLGTLSGGQRKRVALARTLINQPDLLILDEPTNHIDPDTISWLEGYLAKWSGALLLITHDRYFLDRVVTRIIELDEQSLYSYPGNYADFVAARLQREQLREKADLDHRNAVRRELAWLQRGAQARTTKQKARVERATALVNEQRPSDSAALELEISGRRMGKQLIEIEHVAKSIAGRQLISDFSYELERTDRLGIIGPNGSGKSTLLNMIAGRLQPDAGSITIGATIHIAYYDQTSSELDPSQRLIDYVSDGAAVIRTPDGGSITAGQMLERFLFPPTQHWSPISTLSGGERRRLYLLRTLMQNPNVLLLDEPSNDLDVQTLAVLEEFLEQFPGAVIIVSHDRAFLDNTIEHLLIFDGAGRISRFPGGYSAYREAQAAAEAEASRARAATEPRPQPAATSERPRKLSFREQRELAALEAQIMELEAEKERLTSAINSAGSDYTVFTELTAQFEVVTSELETIFERWAELAERAAG